MMMNKGKSFWCEKWHQQVYERLCIHRYAKGLTKCEGCKKGEELIEEEIAQRRREAAGIAASNQSTASGGGSDQ